MEISKAIITEFEFKGKITNPNDQMIQQCVQAIKNSYSQIPKDKKIILLNNLLSIDNLKDLLSTELIYGLCVNEKDEFILSKLILMLKSVKNNEDEDFMAMLSTLLKQTDKGFDDVDQKTMFSSFHITNLIISLSNWNLNQLKFIFSKNQQSNEKIAFLMLEGIKNEKFKKEIIEFCYESFGEISNLTSNFQWKILAFCIEKLQKFDSLDKKIQNLVQQKKKNLIVKKLILDVCVTYGSIYFVKNQQDDDFIQFFSNILFDEEIEEDKSSLMELFELIELKSNKKPFLLPKPIVDKVNFNSTFSQLQ